MKRVTLDGGVWRSAGLSIVALVFAIAAVPLYGKRGVDDGQQAQQETKPGAEQIPAGTILPVVLRTPINSENSKVGQTVDGKIAQDVPLPNGLKVPKGRTIEGHVVEVSTHASGGGARIALRFDRLNVNGQWVPIVTNLRAVAGFMTVSAARVPTEEGAPTDWLPTTQIGGDWVDGARGPVTAPSESSKVIGKSVADGVLVPASAKEGTRCRGAVNGNDHPQAIWVFSSNACGAYGIEDLKIAHSGRSDPKGTIVLTSAKAKLQLRAGDGMLLRVD